MRYLVLLTLLACAPDPRGPIDFSGGPHGTRPDATDAQEPPPLDPHPAQPTCSELLAGTVPGCLFDDASAWHLVSSVPCEAMPCHWGCFARSGDDHIAADLLDCRIGNVVCLGKDPGACR